jgi:hypothetical protein
MEAYSFYCSKCRFAHAGECAPKALPPVIPYATNPPLFYCWQLPETLESTLLRAISANPWADWAVCSVKDYIGMGYKGRATKFPVAGPTGWMDLLLEPDSYTPAGYLVVAKKF